MALADFEGKHLLYHYYIENTVPIDEKINTLKEYLLMFKDDNDFYEQDYYIFSTQDNTKPKLAIQRPFTQAERESEWKTLDKVYAETLELDYNLEKLWNGANYAVFKRRSLTAKLGVLKQFMDKYDGYEFDINTSYDNNKAFWILTRAGLGKTSLIINYLPERIDEASELEKAFNQHSNKQP